MQLLVRTPHALQGKCGPSRGRLTVSNELLDERVVQAGLDQHPGDLS